MAKLNPVPVAREVLGGIGHTKFYDLVQRGDLRLVKIGRRSFVTDDEIERYIDSLGAA